MTLADQLVEFLSCGGIEHARIGLLPKEGANAVAVRPLDLRNPCDENGSLLEIQLCGERALADGVLICDWLDGFEGRLTGDGSVIVRSRLEHGVLCREVDERDRTIYALRLRMWHC